MRTCFAILAGAALLATPSLAFAQGACPPGSWFCDDQPQPPANDGDDAAPDTDTDNGATDEAPLPEEPKAPPKKESKAPPIVVYQPAGEDDKSRVIVVDRPENAPPPARRRYRPHWGLNLRLEGVGMGHDSHNKSGDSSGGMAGLGFSLRYRPVLHFAFDVGADFFGGRDWAGNQRAEDALLINGIIFFNPKDPVQFYTIGGFGFSEAHVQIDNHDGTQPTDAHYSYFGGQLGIGLEFRVTHRVSLNLDAIGFIRGRTDPQAQTQPEFTDPDTGRTTNTSGGGLFRGGITFYW